MANKRNGKGRKKGASRSPATKHRSKPDFPDLPSPRPSSDRRVAHVSAAMKQWNEGRLAAAAAREPMDYRANHKALTGDKAPAVERFSRTLPDAKGAIGNPHRAYDTLATLWRNGSIGDPELEAGRAFEEDFIRARLNPLHASDPARIPSAGVAELSEVMIAGRRRIGRAMTALGGLATPAGSAVWCILGSGQTVKEWAAASQYSDGRRSLNEKVAKGIFVGALGVLAVHYGKLRP